MVASTGLKYNKGYRLPSRKEPKEHSQFVYFLIYNRTKILAGILIAIMIISMISVFAGYCATKQWSDFGGGKDDPRVGGILGFIVDYNGMIDQIVSSNRASEYTSLLSVQASESSFSMGGVSSLGSAHAIVKTVNQIFVTVAWGLALIFWGYEFADMLMQSNGQLIVEQVIKKLMFLVVAFYVIKDSMVFCGEIVNAGTVLMNDVLGSVADVDLSAGAATFKQEIFESCWTEHKIAGLIDYTAIYAAVAAMGYIIMLIIPWGVTKVCDLLVRILIWSRAIEIFIFIAICPIMFIDLGTTRDLTHSSTARALKNLMSLAMQGALIVLSVRVCQAILEGIMQNGLGNSGGEFIDQIWQITLVSILQVGTISKTQNVAKQALGV